MKRHVVSALLAASVTCRAGPAMAQACLGVPTHDAQFNVRGEVAFPQDTRQYSAVVTADLNGPLSFELNAGLIDIDEVEDNGASFGGKLAYEMAVSQLSICPLGGGQYSTITVEETDGAVTLEGDANSLVIPVGIGLGKTLPLGSGSSLTLYAQPQYLHIRSSFEAAVAGIEIDEEAIENEFGIDAGARLGLGRLLVGGAMNWATLPDYDPVFSVTAGVTFGRR
jgi:hypothetical protein